MCDTHLGIWRILPFRVLRTLKEAVLIAAEDTRHSIKLLNHFEINTPMSSYHEYNKVDKARYLVEKMEEGTNIALITDAGTPASPILGRSLSGSAWRPVSRSHPCRPCSLYHRAHHVRAFYQAALPLRHFFPQKRGTRRSACAYWRS